MLIDHRAWGNWWCLVVLDIVCTTKIACPVDLFFFWLIQESEALFHKAIKANPTAASYHGNLGKTFYSSPSANFFSFFLFFLIRHTACTSFHVHCLKKYCFKAFFCWLDFYSAFLLNKLPTREWSSKNAKPVLYERPTRQHIADQRWLHVSGGKLALLCCACKPPWALQIKTAIYGSSTIHSCHSLACSAPKCISSSWQESRLPPCRQPTKCFNVF